MIEERLCRAITKAGTRCQQFQTVDESGLCLWHDPARAEIATAARLRGIERSRQRTTEDREAMLAGLPPLPPLNATSLASVARYQAEIARRVATGVLDTKMGSAATYALTNLRGLVERAELQKRVKQLERQLRDAQRPAKRPGARLA